MSERKQADRHRQKEMEESGREKRRRRKETGFLVQNTMEKGGWSNRDNKILKIIEN